jgi:SAM-dependent methyltransferase
VANDALPPIDLPSGTFDLISGFSVFTHLLETWPAWLLEIHRMLAPGGYAAFTFLGEGMIRDLIGVEWDENRVGMIELDAGRPWSVGGPNALHSEWWLRAHWGRLFEIHDIVPYAHVEARHGHGLICLRKDGRPAPSVTELLRLEPGEPRETASLEFNVQLLKERLAKFWEDDAGSFRVENDHLRSDNDALRRELQLIKSSKSWRLTGSLRHLHSLARRA